MHSVAPDRPTDRPALKLVHRGRLQAVHFRYPEPCPPYEVPAFGIGDAFMVSVMLVPLEADIWRNGRSLGHFAFVPGAVQMFDLRHLWRARIFAPYESVNLRIPIEILAEAAGVDAAALDFDPDPVAVDRVDATLHGLAQALLPAFHRPPQVSALFVDQVLLAAATHLVDAYAGRARLDVARGTGHGLAPWQQRRAAHALLQQLDCDVLMAELAAMCGLSVGHFARGFRASFGLPPHRWLLRERVRRAAHLMSGTNQPIDQIAVACGFVDQSHLTRTFRRVMDITPAAWRRAVSAESRQIATEVPYRHR